jgi:hypothetical protein
VNPFSGLLAYARLHYEPFKAHSPLHSTSH